VNEYLLDGQPPFGQGVVVIPQAQLDPVVPVSGERGGRCILPPQALEEHTILVALYQQSLPGDEAQDLVLLEG